MLQIVGALILLKVRPYRETTGRGLVYNTGTGKAVRQDAIVQACIQLPEDHGIIFPGGYYLQIGAATGWTSVHWLCRLKQRTLVMAGRDDPLIHTFNARLMRSLIPNSELKLFDCGHLFLMTRQEESVRAINEFLDKA